MENIAMDRFLCGRPSSAPTPAHLRMRASQPARYRSAIADRRDPPIGVVFPQILHDRALTSIATRIPIDAPSTHHHPFAVRMPTCAPVTLSRRINCGVPWRPITAARLCLPSSALCRSDAGVDRSVTKPSSRPLRWPCFHYRMRAVDAIV
jgi:hypothetical protein